MGFSPQEYTQLIEMIAAAEGGDRLSAFVVLREIQGHLSRFPGEPLPVALNNYLTECMQGIIGPAECFLADLKSTGEPLTPEEWDARNQPPRESPRYAIWEIERHDEALKHLGDANKAFHIAKPPNRPEASKTTRLLRAAMVQYYYILKRNTGATREEALDAVAEDMGTDPRTVRKWLSKTLKLRD